MTPPPWKYYFASNRAQKRIWRRAWACGDWDEVTYRGNRLVIIQSPTDKKTYLATEGFDGETFGKIKKIAGPFESLRLARVAFDLMRD